MFCCGFDPGFAAYIAEQEQSEPIDPEPAQLWIAGALLVLTITGLFALALLQP